jgi:lipopolysaccharide export system permease protein
VTRIGLHLQRYLAAETARAGLLVLAVFGALLGLIAYLEEAQEVGDGAYTALDALFVVAASLPSQLLGFLPFVVLFGTLLGLADLSRRHELIAIASTGVSPVRLGVAVALPALAWAALALPLDSWLAAPLYRDAMLTRSLRLADDADVLSGSGFWARGDQRFVNVAGLQAGAVPRDVRIYEFDAQRRLARVTEAAFASPQPDGHWQLQGVHVRRYADLPDSPDPVAGADGTLAWRPFFGDRASLQPVPLGSLSIAELARHVRYLEQTRQASRQAETVLWRRMLLPLSTVVMAIIAVPFALGAPRGSGFALRIVGGAGVGLGYFVGDQVLLNYGLLSGLPPPLTALLPVAGVAVVMALVVRRLRA